MPVPKVACTSVKAALAQIDPAQSSPVQSTLDQHHLILKAYPTRRFRPHRWREYEGWWRFALARDPVKRLLSVYSDRVVGRKELHNSPKMRNQSLLPMDPDPDFFFQHLDRYIRVSSVVKHHSIPFRLFLGPQPLLFDRIYKVSEMDELAAELSERAGKKVVIPRLNQSGERITLDQLRPETISFIRAYLQEDYELLKAYYKPPF